MRRYPLAVLGTVLLLVLALAMPAIGQDSDSSQDDPANVLMTFRMGAMESGVRKIKKTYRLVVAEGTPGSSLLAGERVPFPNASTNSEGEVVETTVYQNVGFSTNVRVYRLDEVRIRVVAEIENSSLVEGDAGKAPSVETRALSVNAILTFGQPLELTRVAGLMDEPGFVEVEAKILP